MTKYRKYGTAEGKTKVCNRCLLEHDIINYYDHPRRPIKLSICRDCIAKAYRIKRDSKRAKVLILDTNS